MPIPDRTYKAGNSMRQPKTSTLKAIETTAKKIEKAIKKIIAERKSKIFLVDQPPVLPLFICTVFY